MPASGRDRDGPGVDDLGLDAQGVAGEDRFREGDVMESQLGDDGAEGQFGHRQADHQRDREHAVDQ